MSRDMQITFDCADPDALAHFWAEALGYQMQDPPPGFASWAEALESFGIPEDQRNNRSAVVDPEGIRPRLFFQRVPEGKSAKNRVHLDIRAAPGLEGDARMDTLEAEAKRLIALGATYVSRCDPAPLTPGNIVMTDPEGNEFCLD